MSVMPELDSILKETETHAQALTSCVIELRKLFSSAQETISKDETKPTPEPEGRSPTLEEVRATLANKSRQGYTAEVKALLVKYGADKLSAIDPAKYGELMAEAEVLGND